jgi:hypothetical protein
MMLSAIFFVFLVVMVLGETLVGEVDGCCPLTDGWRSDVLYLDVVERWKWSCCEDCYFFFFGGGARRIDEEEEDRWDDGEGMCA